MRATRQQIPDEAVFDERAVGFSAILLYDHREHAQIAKEFFDRIFVRLSEAGTARLNLWRFDALRDSNMQKLARVDAADADMVIVCAAGTTPLPLEVNALLTGWPSGAIARFGFVTLLADVRDTKKTESPVYQYMADLASRMGCESFARGLLRDWEHPRFVAKDELEAGLMDQEFVAMSAPTTRWGIND